MKQQEDMFVCTLFMQSRPVARIFAGGGAYEPLRREMSSAAGASPKGGLGVFSLRKF